MADKSEAERQRAEQRKRKEALELLKNEEEAREKRIAMRREQRKKAEALRKKQRRARAYKLSGVWLFIIFAVFFALAWFSPEFQQWASHLFD